MTEKTKLTVRQRASIANLKKANEAKKAKLEHTKQLMAAFTKKVEQDMPSAIEDAAKEKLAEYLTKKTTRKGREELFRNMIIDTVLEKEKLIKRIVSNDLHPEHYKFLLGLIKTAASLCDNKGSDSSSSAKAGVIVNISGLDEPLKVEVKQIEGECNVSEQ